MLGLGENADFPKLDIQILHKFGNSGLDTAKIVIRKLLALGRLCAKQRAAREKEVFSLVI